MTRILRLPDDDAARLRRVLAVLEDALPDEAKAAVPFPGHIDAPPLDRFLGRRVLAWIEEREAACRARRGSRP